MLDVPLFDNEAADDILSRDHHKTDLRQKNESA